MQSDIIHFKPYQIYLLRTGEFFIINSIISIDKVNNERCKRCIGQICSLGKQELSSRFFNINVSNSGINFLYVDFYNTYNSLCKDLSDQVISYVGELNDETKKEYKYSLDELYSKQDIAEED